MKDKDINILMGDFNAKVGSDNRGYEEVMGQHALGEMNENGEGFADLCGLNDHLRPQEDTQGHLGIA